MSTLWCGSANRIEKDTPVSWCPKTQANDATYNCGPSNHPRERNPNFHNSLVVVFRENQNNYCGRGAYLNVSCPSGRWRGPSLSA
jgi:hypothetical protein